MLSRVTLIYFGLFISWCAVIALRVVFTRPFEVWWFVGLVAAAVGPFAAGYVYHAQRPSRVARRDGPAHG